VKRTALAIVWRWKNRALCGLVVSGGAFCAFVSMN
jgi:hypothetical protein